MGRLTNREAEDGNEDIILLGLSASKTLKLPPFRLRSQQHRISPLNKNRQASVLDSGFRDAAPELLVSIVIYLSCLSMTGSEQATVPELGLLPVVILVPVRFPFIA